MIFRKLGNTELTVSVLGLGGLHFGTYLDKIQTRGLVRRAFDSGINFIDTAPIYGNCYSEAYIGDAVSGIRDKVILTTKVGLEPIRRQDGMFGVTVAHLTPAYIRSRVDESLHRLKTDYIDLYQLHAFNPETDITETLSVLAELMTEGKIRHYGCSNYSPQELDILISVATCNGLPLPAIAQCHYNMVERRAERELMPLCIRHGIGVVCNRVLARGVLTGRYNRHSLIPVGSRAESSQRIRNWISDSCDLMLVEELQNHAKSQRRTLVELAIAWAMSRLAVTTVLFGVRSHAQLDDCMRAATWALDDDQIREIEYIFDRMKLREFVEKKPEVYFEQ